VTAEDGTARQSTLPPRVVSSLNSRRAGIVTVARVSVPPRRIRVQAVEVAFVLRIVMSGRRRVGRVGERDDASRAHDYVCEFT